MPGGDKVQTRKETSEMQEREEQFKLSFVDALKDPEVGEALSKVIQRANQELIASVAALRSEVQGLRDAAKQKDATIAQLQREVRDLHDQYDALEQYGRRGSLRISGIPESQVDTDAAVVELANTELGLEPPLQMADIDISHRLPQRRGAPPDEPRTVIVRFMTRKDRNRVIAARRKLHQGNQAREYKCYINEDLTTYRSKLFITARGLLRKGLIGKTWTYNGTIKIKDLNGTIRSASTIAGLRQALPDIDPTTINLPAAE